MDALLEVAANLITEGGPAALSALGWLLFLVERYYVTPKREAQFRDDLNVMREANASMASHYSEAIAKMGLVLEVIRDRIGRS